MPSSVPFTWCISLGRDCQVAGQLKKHGLARAPGPFDWLQVHFAGLILTLEEDFTDFLRRDRLSLDGERMRDSHNGLGFRHGLPVVENVPEVEFQKAKAKFEERIADF